MLWAKDLSFLYKSTQQKVLNNLSFEVKKGETVAILGTSGCGKTTLLNYIQGLFEGGEVEVNGSLKIKKNAKIRTVFQEPRLLPWRNAQDNVAFGLEAAGAEKERARKKAQKALELVGLADSVKKFPFQLSLGMQQRVNFARAFATKPDILLMDEPFSALDTETKKTIIEEFKKIIKKHNITTIFVTHNLNEANVLADKIVKIGKNAYEVREKTKSQGESVFNEAMEIDE